VALYPPGRLIDLIKRRLDLPDVDAQDYVARLTTSFNVDHLEPEDWFIAGHKLAWGGHEATAGGAGLRSIVGLHNRATLDQPGLLIVERFMWARGGATGLAQIRLGTGNSLVGNQPAMFRDSQWNPNISAVGVPLGIIRFDNSQAVGAYGGALVSDGLRSGVNVEFVVEGPIILGPTVQLTVTPDIDNSAISVHFHWREYDLRPR